MGEVSTGGGDVTPDGQRFIMLRPRGSARVCADVCRGQG